MTRLLELLREATELLGEMLEACEGLVTGEANLRRAFIVRHAWHIYELSNDAMALAQANRLRSVYLLSRPALESLFKLVAAIQKEEFAAEKVVAEIDEERGKLKRWGEAESGTNAVLQEVSEDLREMAEEFRIKYGVSEQGIPKFKSTWEVAKAADMSRKYAVVYFAGSKFIHGMFKALIERDDALYIPDAIYGLISTVIDAVGILAAKFHLFWERAVDPRIFNTLLDLTTKADAEHEKVTKDLENHLKQTRTEVSKT